MGPNGSKRKKKQQQQNEEEVIKNKDVQMKGRLQVMIDIKEQQQQQKYMCI